MHIPWGMIRGMRNWIAHAYAEMDENVIWKPATNDMVMNRLIFLTLDY